MIRIAALALVLATTAAAQSQGDAARAAIKAQLEGVRAPMYTAAGAVLSDATATYSIATQGCRSRVDVAFPSHTIGSTSHPARSEQAVIEWGKVSSVTLSNTSYVVVAAPGLPDGKRFLYAGSAAGAARLKASMDTLAGACFGPAANTAPTNVPTIAERIYEKPTTRGTAQCRFKAIPELLLTDNNPPTVKIGRFEILPRETGGKNSRFAVSAQSGEQIANWEGILADPQLTLESEAHRAAQVTRAEVTIDGRALTIPVRPVHEANRYPTVIAGKFHSSLAIQPTSYNPGGLLAAVAKGSTMVVRLYAGDREISYWTFDVARLRHMPAALKGARWTCK